MNVKKFLSKLVKTETGCWEFTGARSDGYGMVRHNEVTYKAHRLAWLLFKGFSPEDMLVCHTCDNPSCCNPEHLFLGTKQDNSDDMIRKGRAKHNGDLVCGEHNGHAILTEVEVVEIRNLLDEGFTQQEIADSYGCTRENIKKIKLRQSWRHI